MMEKNRELNPAFPTHPNRKGVFDMMIRFACEADIPQMLELLRQVELVHHGIRPDLFRNGGEKYDAEALRQLLCDPTRPILAAVEDGTMVGYAFCILQTVENDPVLRNRKELYIDDLCVDASARGKGVAKALFDRVRAYGEELGCDALTLNVWEGNDRARRFYEKCGLTPRKTYMELSL